MAKVAAVASQVGVSFDQLNAIMATTESVTRQAPESIGTAWKTIFSRMTDLKVNGQDEDGVTLGDVSGQLSDFGIDILDKQTGELRNLGEVINEVGDSWDTWTLKQKTAIAELIAGKRQYNYVFALFNEWNDMYETALETSETGVGRLQEMQDTYMESNAAIRQQFKAAQEELYSDLFNVDNINTVYKAGTGIAKVIDSIVKSLGGAVPIFLSISGILTQLASNKAAIGLGNIYNNLKSSQLQLQNAKEALALVKEVQQINNIDKDTQDILGYIDKFTTKQQFMNDEQKEFLRHLTEQKQKVIELQQKWDDFADAQIQAAQSTEEGAAIGLTREALQKGGSGTFSKWQTHLNNNIEDINNLRNALVELRNVRRQALTGNITNEEALAQFKQFVVTIQEGSQNINSSLQNIHFRELWAESFNDIVNNNVRDGVFNIEGALRDFNNTLNTTNASTRQLQEDLRGLPQQADEIKNGFDACTEGAKNLGGQLEASIRIEPWLKLGGALTQVIGGLSSINNMINNLSNPDLSWTDKLSSLALVLPSLSYGIKNLFDASQNISDRLKKLDFGTIGGSSKINNTTTNNNQNFIDSQTLQINNKIKALEYEREQIKERIAKKSEHINIVDKAGEKIQEGIKQRKIDIEKQTKRLAEAEEKIKENNQKVRAELLRTGQINQKQAKQMAIAEKQAIQDANNAKQAIEQENQELQQLTDGWKAFKETQTLPQENITEEVDSLKDIDEQINSLEDLKVSLFDTAKEMGNAALSGKGLKAVFDIMKGGWDKLTAAISANPIGAIITAITIAVEAYKWLSNGQERAAEKAEQAMKNIKVLYKIIMKEFLI
jgi:hypothetical protein